jgi:hypothetical protein
MRKNQQIHQLHSPTKKKNSWCRGFRPVPGVIKSDDSEKCIGYTASALVS